MLRNILRKYDLISLINNEVNVDLPEGIYPLAILKYIKVDN
jgi:hypothetical protein